MGLLSSIDQFLGRMVLRAFGSVFLAAGLLACYHAVSQMSDAWGARSWPTVEGEVVSSKVAGGRADIVYRYRVDGEEHTATRVFIGEYSGIESHARAIVAAYPPGAATVLYDPNDPGGSVLEIRFPWTSALLGMLGSILLGVAALLFRKKASFGEMAASVADNL